MKHVIVYGQTDDGADALSDLVRAQAAKLGVAVNVTRESDPARTARAGATRTPALSIDGELVHVGGTPDVDTLEVWLSA